MCLVGGNGLDLCHRFIRLQNHKRFARLDPAEIADQIALNFVQGNGNSRHNPYYINFASGRPGVEAPTIFALS